MMRGTGLGGAILHNLCLKSAGLVTTLVLDFPLPMSTTLYTHSFASDTLSSTSLSLSSTSSSSSSRLQPIQRQQELQQDTPTVEDQYNTLFCRALYDYVAQDPSALSFRTNDIIEVLTQQPSGWWDGLLGEERGWFPSNYVTIISDEEAELAFSQAENTTVDGQNSEPPPEPSVDASQAMTAGAQAEQEEWLDSEISFRNGDNEPHRAPIQGGNQPSDFWMPEVTPDGQVSGFEIIPSIPSSNRFISRFIMSTRRQDNALEIFLKKLRMKAPTEISLV